MPGQHADGGKPPAHDAPERGGPQSRDRWSPAPVPSNEPVRAPCSCPVPSPAPHPITAKAIRASTTATPTTIAESIATRLRGAFILQA
jgi:hypothetical protein